MSTRVRQYRVGSPRRRPGLLLSAALFAGAVSAGRVAPARADALDGIGKKLVDYDSVVRQLSNGIRRPSELGVGGGRGRDLPTRRTIDAEVNFGIGNYEDAAIVLYDVVEKYPQHKVYDEALYYLAESLFMKGDSIAARQYFVRVAKERGPASPFYQQSLERLIEITLRTGDAEGVDQWLSLLEAVPAAQRRSSVPYIRGKYAFFNGRHDEAIAQFEQVAKGSTYWFQARYSIGAAQVAQKDLARAMRTFSALTLQKPKTKEEERVVELANLAIGRIHYERDQASKAVDRYLQISRHSDLFDEAMYEVAWVYVKNKQFDRALRALELLALSDPMSTRLPDVKILEGNLRIRKAERLADTKAGQASRSEYGTARLTFEKLRKLYELPHTELARVIAEGRPPQDYLAQVTGRHAQTFDIKATVPELAAAWLREEPEVKRIVAVEGDLGQIEGDVAVTEKTIYRLEQALGTASRVNIFPALAEKRVRAAEIQDDLNYMRVQLAMRERVLVSRAGGDQGQLDRLAAERKAVAQELAALPDASARESERITRSRGRTVALDRSAAEAGTIIGASEAQLVAMEKYLNDQGYKEIKPGDLSQLKSDIDQSRAEVEAMKQELGSIRDDVLLARDRAGTGDETTARRGELRARLRVALDAEHQAALPLAARLDGDARAEADRIAALTRQAASIAARLDQANARIDQSVEEALGEVNLVLAEERAKLGAHKQEYVNYDDESHGLGGEILGLAFGTVSKKLYEILMRSDVGVVNVAWSVKEVASRALRGLTLDQARQTRTLDSEFSDVVQEIKARREQQLQQQQQQPSPPPATEGGTR